MGMYTMKQWEADGELKIAVGQVVSDEVIAELRDCVPPTFYGGGIFQVGEAKDQDSEHPSRAIYDTFFRLEEGWRYCGTCLYGKTEPRKGFIESLYAVI